MNAQEYYHRIIDRLRHCYQFNHYLIATGNELIAEGCNPAFPALTEPVHQLDRLTLDRGLQVHLPIVGEQSQSVLMPLDFEIFLAEENHTLYTDKEAQKNLFEHVIPVAKFLENFFRSRGIPYLLDYTPSGGHILFHNLLGYRATEEVKNLGVVGGDLIQACHYIDPGDVRRWHGISLDAARIFSGLGKLAEYIALVTIEAFKCNESEGLLPVTICDSYDRCINFDNSWCEGSPFMRSMRSPFSLHKKNQEKYGKVYQPPLVDVIGTYFDGENSIEASDMDFVLNCMWDLEKAADHALGFSGFIPCSNETLIDLVREYRSSDLFAFHHDFDSQEALPRGHALDRAKSEGNIPEWTRSIVHFPNPSALQPAKLMGFVYDFLIYAQWKPKHIANILRDMYQNASFHWTQDFFLYPAEEKANFWARTYSALALWKTGKLHV